MPDGNKTILLYVSSAKRTNSLKLLPQASRIKGVRVLKMKNMESIKFIFSCLCLFSKNSTTETLKTLPFLGQFLGRLCWNPYVTAEGEWHLLKKSHLRLIHFDDLTHTELEICHPYRELWTFLCLQLQAEGCCSSVCGGCTRSIQAMLWKEKPTSGYGYGLDFVSVNREF